MIIRNDTIAILTKLNDLASRFDLKPYEVTVEVSYNPATNQTELNFTGESIVNRVRKKTDAMIDAIVGRHTQFDGIIAGDASNLIDLLDRAISKAPKPRTI